MEKRSLNRPQIFRPLLFDMNERPLPPAETEVLQSGNHQALIRRIHYDLLSQRTPSGRSASTQTI